MNNDWIEMTEDEHKAYCKKQNRRYKVYWFFRCLKVRIKDLLIPGFKAYRLSDID